MLGGCNPYGVEIIRERVDKEGTNKCGWVEIVVDENRVNRLCTLLNIDREIDKCDGPLGISEVLKDSWRCRVIKKTKINTPFYPNM